MNKEEILKEEYFRSINMSIEERDFILELLSNCKDIKNSKYSETSGKIVELSMKKETDNLINLSGSVAYDNENRTLQGTVMYYKDNIIFRNKMTRLCYEGEDKEYFVLDTFSPTDIGYDVVSYYSNDKTEYKNELNMKGKVK